MKRESALLLEKACDSLVLSIEFFNRPYERGRVSATLILLDHAFEMLLKAAILHKGGRIRERRKRETIGFDACVRKAFSEATVQCVTEEQALLLQTINGLRDAAQHHLLEISEGQLYMHAQAGITLFRDLLRKVFEQDLADCLPTRVLPVSVSPPTDLATLFDSEVAEVMKLLKPGKRRRLEAETRLRPLAILDATIRGEKGQPSNAELRSVERELLSGRKWSDIFRGVASVEITASGSGHALSLRLSKKEGVPVQLVPEGTPEASVVAVRRVDELAFYNLGRDQVASKVGLSGPKTTAMIRHLKLDVDADCSKEFCIGKSKFRRYSPKAIEKIMAALKTVSPEDVWRKQQRGSSAEATIEGS